MKMVVTSLFFQKVAEERPEVAPSRPREDDCRHNRSLYLYGLCSYNFSDMLIGSCQLAGVNLLFSIDLLNIFNKVSYSDWCFLGHYEQLLQLKTNLLSANYRVPMGTL